MNTSNADNEFPGFVENSEPVVPTEAELGLLNLNLKTEVIRTGKIRELGIFTVGIGIIITLLTLWISFVAAPVPGRPIPLAGLAVPLIISAIYFLCGILTLQLKTRPIIQTTMVLVTLGFVFDLLTGFNIIKAVFSVLAIGLIVKTGREALKEASLQKPAG